MKHIFYFGGGAMEATPNKNIVGDSLLTMAYSPSHLMDLCMVPSLSEVDAHAMKEMGETIDEIGSIAYDSAAYDPTPSAPQVDAINDAMFVGRHPVLGDQKVRIQRAPAGT